MMADGVEFRMTGADVVLGRMQEVSSDVRMKGGRFALRKAAQKLRDQAKANADRIDDPSSDAKISSNIVERFSSRLYKRTGNIGFRIGVLGGAGGNRSGSEFSGFPGGDTRHWRHLEFGTSQSAAKPFMRPVINQAGQAAVNEFSRQYLRALDRAIRRARRRRAQ